MSVTTLAISPGIELAYIDSGAPKVSGPYITIFALHGLSFTNCIFTKLQTVAFERGFRFVSINRRGYPGSTPFNGDEADLIINAQDIGERGDYFMAARGHEVASFIDIFAQKYKLHPVSDDGQVGGSIVFGWSLGSQTAAASLAYAPSLPLGVRSRLALHIRSLVIYDVPPFAFGLPMSEKTWMPIFDTNIAEQQRLPMFGQWVTGYFDNGDYLKRDVDSLAHVVHSSYKAPTIYSMPAEELEDMIFYEKGAILDLNTVFSFGKQFRQSYRKAFSTPHTPDIFPKLKIKLLAAERSAAYALSGIWAVQDDLKELGLGQNVTYEILKDANHFLHWDDPGRLMDVLTVSIHERDI